MSKPHRKNRPVRSLVVNAVLITLAFGLLGLAIGQNRQKIAGVFDRGIDARLFSAAIAFYMVALVLSFVRWHVLVRVIEPRFALRDSLRLGFIGNVFNLVIPGGVGGDVVKAAYLMKMDIKRTQAVALTVIDRLLGLLGLFILAGLAGVAAWPLADRQIHTLIVLVWAAGVAGVAALWAIFNPSLMRALLSRSEGHGRGAGILRELRVLSETYRKRRGLVATVLLGCSGIHLLFVVAFYLVSLAIFPGGLPGLGRHLLIVPLNLFSTAIPLPFGAMGVSEFVSDRLFALVGHSEGLLAMMAFRVLMYGGGLASVGVYLSQLRQVRALSSAVEEFEGGLLGGHHGVGIAQAMSVHREPDPSTPGSAQSDAPVGTYVSSAHRGVASISALTRSGLTDQ